MIEADKVKRDKETIIEFAKYMAESMQKISNFKERVRYICDTNEYDAELCYVTDDAIRSMGMVLAGLVNWMEEDKTI